MQDLRVVPQLKGVFCGQTATQDSVSTSQALFLADSCNGSSKSCKPSEALLSAEGVDAPDRADLHEKVEVAIHDKRWREQTTFIPRDYDPS